MRTRPDPGQPALGEASIESAVAAFAARTDALADSDHPEALSCRDERIHGLLDFAIRGAHRAILITGSTGIAAAAAERFVAEGASVVVTSRSAEHARALAECVGAAWAQAELTDEAAVGAAVAAAVQRFGRIDGLFSVAGGSGRRFGDGPIHTVTGDAREATGAPSTVATQTAARAETGSDDEVCCGDSSTAIDRRRARGGGNVDLAVTQRHDRSIAQ